MPVHSGSSFNEKMLNRHRIMEMNKFAVLLLVVAPAVVWGQSRPVRKSTPPKPANAPAKPAAPKAKAAKPTASKTSKPAKAVKTSH